MQSGSGMTKTMASWNDDGNMFHSNKHFDKLAKAGFASVVDFVEADLRFLSLQTGIVIADLQLLRASLLATMERRVVTADMLVRRMEVEDACLSSGIAELDEMLELVKHGQILEICGPSSCGKTEICLRIAVNTWRMRPVHVTYIDTCGQVDTERLRCLIGSAPDAERVESGLKLVRVHNIPRLLQLLRMLENLSSRDAGDRAQNIVVIDSMYSLFAAEISGGSAEGFGLMNLVVFAMKKLIVTKRYTFIVTNLGSSRSSGGSLGTFWQSVPNHRILLEDVGALDYQNLWTPKLRTITATAVKSNTEVLRKTSRPFTFGQ